jgi:DNA-binding XRE family transcriptional regulator
MGNRNAVLWAQEDQGDEGDGGCNMGVKDGREALARAGEFTRSLGHTIKVLRVDQGQTRQELGERAGISYSYVAQIENGRTSPSSPVLLRLAEALGMSASDLLAFQERGAVSGQVSSGSKRADRTSPGRPPASKKRQPGHLAEKPKALNLAGPSLPVGQESPGGAERSPALNELWDLLARLSPPDLERVLDLARRLAG